MRGFGMFPWDVVVTGVVGIAGIGGAILAARITTKTQTANLLLSIDAENKRARVAEKRRLYAGFLASVNAVMPVTLNYRRIKEQRISGEERDKAFDELIEAEGVMTTKSMEARLIAPRNIRILIASLTNAYLKYGLDSMSGVTDLVRVEELVPFNDVLAAMREDLGDAE
jgi:hypothetical protein